VARIFEIKLLSLLGIMPSLDVCANCGKKPDASARFSIVHGGLICKGCIDADKKAFSVLQGTVKFIEHVRNLPFEKVERIKVSAMVGKELEAILRKFLDYHIERRLKTVEFLKEIEQALV
jgi:DNA repair protein RecO (recombination protein O)